MRIILVLDTAHVNGGQAKVAIDSALALKSRGHEPVIFAAFGPVDSRLGAAGIPVHCLGQSELVADANFAAAVLRGLHNAVASRALGALLAQQPRGETLIHVHGWAKALSSAIGPPIAASGLPCLYTMHEYFLLCPNGGFFNYRTNTHCPLDPLSGTCVSTMCDTRTFAHKSWRTLRFAIAKHVHHLPKAMGDVAYFHPYQRSIIARHLPKGTRLHEIANPVEVDDSGPKADPATGEFTYVGRMAVEKGVLVFAEAARMAGIAPVFVGDGPAAAEIAARFPEAKLLGWHDPAGVRARLRAARALVFPSLWHEGQPLTVLEALALGTPVIAGDGNAGRESVIDGETGLWFRHNDPADLAAKLHAMRDDAMLERLAKAAHARYWAHPFTLARHALRLEEVYAGLLAGPAGAGRAAAGRIAASR